MSDYSIKEAFERIENELIDSMMRNFSRHRAEEIKEGYNWSQWQAEQLKSLEEYRKHNAKKFGKRFKTINSKVEEMIRTAKADGSSDQEAEILETVKNGFKPPEKPSAHSTGEFFKVNERKLDALVKSTTDDLKRAETAVLRMSNDKYRKAIYNAQVAMNTGAVTYEQAVDIACKDMLNAGLNCVEYKTVQDTPCPTMRIWQLKPQTSVLICVVRAKQEPNGECRLLWSIQDRAVALIVQNISAKCLLTMCIQTAKSQTETIRSSQPQSRTVCFIHGARTARVHITRK